MQFGPLDHFSVDSQLSVFMATIKEMNKLITLMVLTIAFFSSLGQTYHVGDLYTAQDGTSGIVFYTFPDGSGGWAVALNDASLGCQWGTNTDVSGLTNSNPTNYQQLTEDTAGYAHTAAIRAFQNNNPAYAAGTMDFDHGWYLPTAEQLTLLYAQRVFINQSITSAGGSLLSDNCYWSSTECSATEAWVVDFGLYYSYSGAFYKRDKQLEYPVRAVITFSSFSYDLTYQWSTGATTPDITVSPTQTTTYTVTVSTSGGCADTLEQTIVVNSVEPQTFYDEVCQGEPYIGNGFSISEDETSTPGMVVRTRAEEVNGCETTYTLELTVNAAPHTDTEASVCESYEWNGTTYTQSGDYPQIFTAANGCDSVVTLHLTVNYGTHNVETETVCESYTWHGTTYAEAGTYIYEYTNADGCPSADTLHLTVNYGSHNTFTETVCDHYIWNEEEYAESGIYRYEYVNVSGCPSTDTLHLTVNHGTHNVERRRVLTSTITPMRISVPALTRCI